MRTTVALSAAFVAGLASMLGGCSGDGSQSPDGGYEGGVIPVTRALACPPAKSAEPIPWMPQESGARVRITFEMLVQAIDDKCSPCHRDTTTGGFHFADVYSTGDPSRQGIADAAAMMVMMMTRTDSLRMPPGDTDPEGTMVLAETLQAWIDAGKPMDSFLGPAPPPDTSPDGGAAYSNGKMGPAMTNLGDCVPRADMIANMVDPDVALDQMFASATALPPDLAQTDMTTLDTFELAKKRLFAFAPTYQLWADNARKIRMVRVPKGQQITFDPQTKKFVIPVNTRFYKTFFKRVLDVDGQSQWRRIETRLIVSRPDKDGQPQALFGSYRWNDDQTEATLWQGPYRDGTPFADAVFPYRNAYENCQRDLATGRVLNDPETGGPMCDQVMHTYAIPGRDRCIQCHEGAEGANFVLGFTPLQINRRPVGQGGVYEDVGPDELNQFQRLIDYGVIAPYDPSQALLENSAGDRKPRNVYELQAQAYMVGNCAHCHNRNGFPTRDNPGLAAFNLAPGGLMFQFPVVASDVGYVATISGGGAPYVSPGTVDLNFSSVGLIYRRVATPMTSVWTDPSGLKRLVVQHMPANTPGMDCRAPEIIGRWMLSILLGGGDPTAAATQTSVAQTNALVASFNPGCVAPPDVQNWVSEDLTEPKIYRPRRSDWNTWTHADDGINRQLHPELIHGIPKELRDIAIDDGIKAIATTPVPYGYWTWKPQCQFPDSLPGGSSSSPGPNARPWMFTDQAMRQPTRPLGEVYMSTPGAAIFKAVCSRCHGIHADGNSGNAKALYALSGGTIRVANLMRGLFGPQGDPDSPPGSNLPLFDAPNPNANGESMGPLGAARYLTWMASGGTNVKFPDGFEALLGNGDANFGGNMLTKVNYICSQLLPRPFPTPMPDDPDFSKGIPDIDRELWSSFCTYNNPLPSPDQLAGFDEQAWRRKAQFNGGLMMFFFFRDLASHGTFPPGPTECEQVYPQSAATN